MSKDQKEDEILRTYCKNNHCFFFFFNGFLCSKRFDINNGLSQFFISLNSTYYSCVFYFSSFIGVLFMLDSFEFIDTCFFKRFLLSDSSSKFDEVKSKGFDVVNEIAVLFIFISRYLKNGPFFARE